MNEILRRRRALMGVNAMKLSLFNFADSIDALLKQGGFERIDVDVVSGAGNVTVTHNLGVTPQTYIGISEDINFTGENAYKFSSAFNLTSSSSNAGATTLALSRSATSQPLNNLLTAIEPEINWNAPLSTGGAYWAVASVSATNIVLRNSGSWAESKMKTGKWRVYVK